MHTSHARLALVGFALTGLLAAAAPAASAAPTATPSPTPTPTPIASATATATPRTVATRTPAARPQAMPDYTGAKAGDIVDVRIGDVHPTQPSLGYDEVYYKLGRYSSLGKDKVNKKFADWCEASGLLDATAAQPNAVLSDPTTFTCALQPGQETAASKDLMKTVVIGPNNSLWLTDGHHTLTALSSLAGDGGMDMHIRLRVIGNLSNLSEADFWSTMVANKWTWLQTMTCPSVRPQDLPKTVGLGNFADDPSRGLLYFSRDIAYSADGAIPFQEFYWGAWIQQNHPELLTFDRTNFDTYQAQMLKVANLQVSLDPNAPVYGGYTAAQLSAFTALDTTELTKAQKPYSDKKPSKIAYMTQYKSTFPDRLVSPAVIPCAQAATPTPDPTAAPSVTPAPTTAPVPTVTAAPTAVPTATPTAVPTATATPAPKGPLAATGAETGPWSLVLAGGAVAGGAAMVARRRQR